MPQRGKGVRPCRFPSPGAVRRRSGHARRLLNPGTHCQQSAAPGRAMCGGPRAAAEPPVPGHSPRNPGCTPRTRGHNPEPAATSPHARPRLRTRGHSPSTGARIQADHSQSQDSHATQARGPQAPGIVPHAGSARSAFHDREAFAPVRLLICARINGLAPYCIFLRPHRDGSNSVIHQSVRRTDLRGSMAAWDATRPAARLPGVVPWHPRERTGRRRRPATGPPARR